MNPDKIYCVGCKKEIDLFEDTKPVQNENWDLICQICGQWLGGMKNLFGWEINIKENK